MGGSRGGGKRILKGIGELLVTNMEDIDRGFYLLYTEGESGDGDEGGGGEECGILFPTDFRRLVDYAETVLK